MKATQFIETRQTVQQEAFDHVSHQLDTYEVETKGIYIQDVVRPMEPVKVLTEREIASQEPRARKPAAFASPWALQTCRRPEARPR